MGLAGQLCVCETLLGSNKRRRAISIIQYFPSIIYNFMFIYINFYYLVAFFNILIYIVRGQATWTIFRSENVIITVFQFIHSICCFDCTCRWICGPIVNKGVARWYLLTVIFLTFKCTSSTYKCFAKRPFFKSWTFLDSWSIVEPSAAVVPKQAFVFHETTCIKLVIILIIANI